MCASSSRQTEIDDFIDTIKRPPQSALQLEFDTSLPPIPPPPPTANVVIECPLMWFLKTNGGTV